VNLVHRAGQEPGASLIDELWNGLRQAINLLFNPDSALTEIVALSLRVSGIALLFSTLIGVPVGAALGLTRFFGRKLVVAFMYTGMGFPPVVIGLFVYLMLSRSGPLGQLDSPLIPNLFTPGAMIIAQTIIAFPLVAGFTMAAVMGVDPQLRQQVQSLGATAWQTAWTVITEARIGVIVAVIAVMLVGGNIDGRTRVLTTAIVLETRKGNFELAIALGLILLGITFVINALMLRLQGKAIDT
jgi:tungstate transport system permease protein